MSKTSEELRGRAHQAHLAAEAADDKDTQQIFAKMAVSYAAMAEIEEWLEGEQSSKPVRAAA